MNIEKLKTIIEESKTLSDVLKKLNLSVTNGNYRTFK